jgi:hypothetical protein
MAFLISLMHCQYGFLAAFRVSFQLSWHPASEEIYSRGGARGVRIAKGNEARATAQQP